MGMNTHAIVALIVPLGILAAAEPTPAADTLETWAAGSGDIDFSITVDSVGHQTDAQSLTGDMLVGWGVADRLSAFMAVSLAANSGFSEGGAEMGVGLFGTPLDTDHVDLDLMLDLFAGGSGLRKPCLHPSLELNLDAAPDGTAWGAYARAGLEVSSDDGDSAKSSDIVGSSRVVDGLLTVGSYLTLQPGRQLLLEYDLTFVDRPTPGAPRVERGGLALGYNQMITGTLEFVTQAYWDLPQGAEDGAVGMTFGIVAAIPGAGGNARSEIARP